MARATHATLALAAGYFSFQNRTAGQDVDPRLFRERDVVDRRGVEHSQVMSHGLGVRLPTAK